MLKFAKCRIAFSLGVDQGMAIGNIPEPGTRCVAIRNIPTSWHQVRCNWADGEYAVGRRAGAIGRICPLIKPWANSLHAQLEPLKCTIAECANFQQGQRNTSGQRNPSGRRNTACAAAPLNGMWLGSMIILFGCPDDIFGCPDEIQSPADWQTYWSCGVLIRTFFIDSKQFYILSNLSINRPSSE